MAEVKLSARYANALIKEAQEKNVLDNVFNDFKIIKETISTSRDLKLMLKSPIIKSDKKKEILTQVFKGNISDLTNEFINVLVSKGREGFLEDISNVFFEEYNTLKEITSVEITSAVSLTDTTITSIIDKLKSQLGLKNVEVSTNTNKNILGGFIIKIGDQIFDSSIANKLNNLKRVLIN